MVAKIHSRKSPRRLSLLIFSTSDYQAQKERQEATFYTCRPEFPKEFASKPSKSSRPGKFAGSNRMAQLKGCLRKISQC